jgi:predicted transcriptional regulator
LHSVKHLGFEVLNILGHTGGSSRMELFHAFDGRVNWRTVKVIISILLDDGMIKKLAAEDPGKAKFVLTGEGKNLFMETFPEDAPTESLEA